MPVLANMAVQGALTGAQALQVPPQYQTSALKATGGGTLHTYTGDAQSLSSLQEVHLEVVLVAYQIHPYTLDQLDQLGPIGGRNWRRWSLEGPTCPRDGEPDNCTIQVQIAHSPTATAGTDWKEYRPGLYRLRSYNARIRITRPNTNFDFRVHRFAVRVARLKESYTNELLVRAFSNG